MFIWDFVADTVLGQIIDWIYGQIVGFLGDFFMQMGNMGTDLFEMSWVQSIVLFFSYLAWALYVLSLIHILVEGGYCEKENVAADATHAPLVGVYRSGLCCR